MTGAGEVGRVVSGEGSLNGHPAAAASPGFLLDEAELEHKKRGNKLVA